MPLVQSATVTNGASSATVAFGAAPTNGNLLIADVMAGGAANVALLAITQAGWNIAAGIGGSVGGADGAIRQFWKIANGDGANVEATTGGTAARVDVHVYEYSAADGWPANPLDRTSTNTGSAASLSTGTTAATTQADELLHAAVGQTGNNNGLAAGWTNGFAQRNLTARMLSADRVVAAVGTYETTGAWATSRPCRAVLATYKPRVPVTGVALVPLGALTVAGAGVREAHGQAVLNLGALDVTASGVRTVVGDTSVPLGGLIVVAEGVRQAHGMATFALGPLDVTAVGVVIPVFSNDRGTVRLATSSATTRVGDRRGRAAARLSTRQAGQGPRIGDR